MNRSHRIGTTAVTSAVTMVSLACKEVYGWLSVIACACAVSAFEQIGRTFEERLPIIGFGVSAISALFCTISWRIERHGQMRLPPCSTGCSHTLSMCLVIVGIGGMVGLAAYGFGTAIKAHEPLNEHSHYLAGISACVGLMWTCKLAMRLRLGRTVARLKQRQLLLADLPHAPDDPPANPYLPAPP